MATFVILNGHRMTMDQFEQLLQSNLKKQEILSYNGEDKLRVVVKEPLKEPEIKLIKNDYKSMQAIVGGSFECIPFGKTGLDCIIIRQVNSKS